ncbi:unnamed protein product [Thelazia callipaeda]|uniref:Uncharacterized protein n=1 Tax=Thelazia callipaeda TaxID=103827 RepID=A0A158RD55_THECL|nr:unnamed protein product [Thelazia callipaeda]
MFLIPEKNRAAWSSFIIYSWFVFAKPNDKFCNCLLSNLRIENASVEIFQTMKNCTDAEVQSCLKKESGQKNESNNVVYLPSSILDEFKAKKKNLKQIQAEVEWKGTKLPVDHEHCGTGKSMVKALFGSERTICEERGGRPSCISQVNDIILKEESCSSNPKRSKPGTRRRKARVSACRNIKVRKETKKRSTLRRSSNTKTEPEPSKLNFDKESAAEIRDSLENCKCSPIRSNFLHQSLFSEESHILSRQQPFLSSTPLSKAEKRAAAQVNENKNNTSEVEKGNEVALRGEKGIDSANKAKVGKIKRCGVRKTKVSKQTANLGIELKTSGVATRLRSRQKLTLSSVPVALKSRNR